MKKADQHKNNPEMEQMETMLVVSNHYQQEEFYNYHLWKYSLDLKYFKDFFKLIKMKK